MANLQEAPPPQRPLRKRLARRVNNAIVYATIRRAIRECGADMPVLMAPCGYGWFFERFRHDGIDVVGIDIEQGNIALARAAVNPPMVVHQGDILQLPFKDGEFDFVVSQRFLLHFEDDFRAKAIRELARVARRYVLVHYDYPVSLRQWTRRLRGATTPYHDTTQDRGWMRSKRKTRKQYCNREMMAAEGALAGLKIKKLYFVLRFLSDRVYCLFEK
jgi:SAM-dependent methyltransferase